MCHLEKWKIIVIILFDCLQQKQRVQPVRVVQQPELPEEEYEIEDEISAEEERKLIEEEQAKNAYYTFGTSIDDKINDHSIQRQETREGLTLKGMYSYSDGFFKRTIHYEAGPAGYVVTK